MADDKTPDDADEATQGAAVAKALAGDDKRAVDRWEGFSKADVKKLADDPAPPEAAEKPLAGMARDGGVVEGEKGSSKPKTR